MDPILIKITVRRFFELLVTCSVISAFITLLNVAGVLITKNAVCVAMLAGIIMFVLLNVRMLRQCYFEMRSFLIYYSVNLTAYFLFAAVCFAVYFLTSNTCFTWLFAITKFVRFSNLELPTLSSAVLFHIIGVIMVIASPLGMKWIFMFDYDDDGEDVGDSEDEYEYDE